MSTKKDVLFLLGNMLRRTSEMAGFPAVKPVAGWIHDVPMAKEAAKHRAAKELAQKTRLYRVQGDALHC